MVVHMHDLGDTESAQLTRLCWPALRVLPAPSSTTTTITNLQTARCSRNTSTLSKTSRPPTRNRFTHTALRWCAQLRISLRTAECCDKRARACVCVCVCVCVFVIISSELHVLASPSFLRLLPMAVARFSSGGVVIRYVLPVLWMTSYFLILQGCSTSPHSGSAVHTQPWAWL